MREKLSIFILIAIVVIISYVFSVFSIYVSICCSWNAALIIGAIFELLAWLCMIFVKGPSQSKALSIEDVKQK